MKHEHGIDFNQPYVRLNLNSYTNTDMIMSRGRMNGSSSSNGGAVDTPEVLIPLSVIDDHVFCIAMMLRTSTTPTEYEVQAPSYPGGMPTTNSFYWQEQERLAYFTMINVKEFIDQWKLKE